MKSRLSVARWLALAALATFCLQPATADSQGMAFTYQGRLNANGSTANGLYDLRFEVWDALTNGNMVAGPITNSATGVTNGLFVVALDFGPGVFTGLGRWLELDVRTNGNGVFTTLLPLQQLLPVPYAIMANTASNLLGTLPATQLSGTLPSSTLAGYSGPVTFTNAANRFVGAFAGDGSGLTHLAGAALQPGTVSSNALDGPTKAQLALAVGGGGALTNPMLAAGSNVISAALVGVAGPVETNYGFSLSVEVAGATGTNTAANGNYAMNLQDASDMFYTWTNSANANLVLSMDLFQNFSSHRMAISNGTSLLFWNDGTIVIAWPDSALATNAAGASATVYLPTNYAAVGWQITGPVYMDLSQGTNLPPVSWVSGVANKPLTYTLVPGQQRPMKARIGWNSWYDMNTGVSGPNLTNVANEFIAWGLRDAGWTWLGIDYGWFTPTRDATTHWMVPNSGSFPQGMAAFVAGMHSMGFKVGLYTDFAFDGATNYPATALYPVQDAQAMFTWNVDDLKFDGVGSAAWMSTFYDNVQSLCLSNGRAPLYIETYCTPTDGFGVYQDPRLALWANSQLPSRDWPTTAAQFMSLYASECGSNSSYYSTFVPAVGLLVSTNYCSVPPTNAFNAVKAQMSVIAMLSGDMIANAFNGPFPSNSLSTPPAAVLTAMLNTNVLAIDQDPAQVTGWPIINNASTVVWVKPLGSVSGPEWVVTIWNPSTTAWSTNSFGLTNLPALFTGGWRAVELWSMTTQMVTSVITCTNVPFEPKMYRLTPIVDTGASASSSVQASSIIGSLPLAVLPSQVMTQASSGLVSFGGPLVLATNAMANWPAAAATPGGAAFVNSNSWIYLLQSSPGSTAWTSTNKIGK